MISLSSKWSNSSQKITDRNAIKVFPVLRKKKDDIASNSFSALRFYESLACSKLYFDVVGGPRIEPKSWPLGLGNFEHRSELGIKKSLNPGFCPEAKEQMKCCTSHLMVHDGETSLSSVFLPGPQEEADVSGPLLLCEEFQVLHLDANLINIFREFIFPCSAVTRPSGPPLLLLIGNPTYLNVSDFYGLNFIHLPRPSNKEICLSPKPS